MCFFCWAAFPIVEGQGREECVPLLDGHDHRGVMSTGEGLHGSFPRFYNPEHKLKAPIQTHGTMAPEYILGLCNHWTLGKVKLWQGTLWVAPFLVGAQ